MELGNESRKEVLTDTEQVQNFNFMYLRRMISSIWDAKKFDLQNRQFYGRISETEMCAVSRNADTDN